MAKNKILIVLEGGLIQNILLTNPDIEVCVIDYDLANDHGADSIEAAMEEAVCVRETGTFDGSWASTLTGNLSATEKLVLDRLVELDKEFPYEVPRDEVYQKMGEYLSEEDEYYDKIIAALKKELKRNPTMMLDHVEINKGTDDEVDMETISVWEKVEQRFTVQEFCDLVGITNE